MQVCLKIWVFPNIESFPVVKARTPHGFFVNFKPQWVDEVKHATGHSHRSADVAGVVGDLRGMKDDVKHRVVLYEP